MEDRQTSSNVAAIEDDQVAVRVAWLYFVEGWTQGKIAEEMSTNRLRINKIINDARRSGLVTIKIRSRLTSSVELEREMVRAFGLKHAIVVPTPHDSSSIASLIGQVTAEFIAHLISSQPIRNIATSWGATNREIIRYLPPMRRPDLTIHSALGGLTRGTEINTFDIAAGFARQLGADCSYLAAPLYASSAQSRDAFLEEASISEALKQVACSDMIITSLGDLTERSLLVRTGLPPDVSVKDLAAAGACGDLMGHLLKRDGQPVSHPINQRCITLPLSQLKTIPYVVICAGGLYKAEILAAALVSRRANVVITDESTAHAALALCSHLNG